MVDGEWAAETVVPKTLVAHHDKNTSETYSETIQFRSLNRTIAMRMRLTSTLARGKKFKLMGIALCE
jgi:hypothetical protein